MQSFKVNELDFIVSCAGTIGEVFKLPYGSPIGIINQALMKATLFDEEISDYFEIVFMIFFINYLKNPKERQLKILLLLKS